MSIADSTGLRILDHYLAVEANYLRFADKLLNGLFFPNEVRVAEERSPLTNLFDDLSSAELQYFDQAAIPIDNRSDMLDRAERGEALSVRESLFLLQMSLRNWTSVTLAGHDGTYITVGDDYYFLVGLPQSVDIGQFLPSAGLYAYPSAASPFD